MDTVTAKLGETRHSWQECSFYISSEDAQLGQFDFAYSALHFLLISSSDCNGTTQIGETFFILKFLAVQLDFILLFVVSSHHFAFLLAYPEASPPCIQFQVVSFGLLVLKGTHHQPDHGVEPNVYCLDLPHTLLYGIPPKFIKLMQDLYESLSSHPRWETEH